MKSIKRIRKLLPSTIPLLASLAPVHQACADSYTITDLGTALGRSIYNGSIYNWDINNAGQVVGSNGAGQAVLYNNGVLSPLGSLGGTNSYARSINDNGQIVGYAITSGGAQHAFIYSNGTMSNLGISGPTSSATDINNSGQITGTVFTGATYPSGGPEHKAYLLSNGSIETFGTSPTSFWSEGYGINNSGDVVGTYASNGDGERHAFVYSSGVFTDLGIWAGGNWALAQAINDSGQIAGWASAGGSLDNNNAHAFLFSNGTMSDLGTLGGSGSAAFGINSVGQVVGYSYLPDDTAHAFLFSNGSLLDLNTFLEPNLGWTLESADAINDLGQIVGSGFINGENRAFLLTPNTVPVPSSLGLFGSGLLGLFAASKRKSKQT